MIDFIKQRYCLLIFLLPLGSLSFGQQNSFLEGRVTNQNTKEPVVFATVVLKGAAKGIITNMDGSFRLPVRYKDAGDTIQISSMGYQKKNVALRELLLHSSNIIQLVPGILELDEAVVRAKRKKEPSARQIVRRAIARIPQNFPTNDFATKGYYRDYQLDGLGYLNLNEALLEVFDAGFDEIDMLTNKVRIYDYVQNENFRRDSLAADPYNYNDYRKIMDNAYLPAYGGNEFEILRVHDAVRNYELNSFDFINNLSKGGILRNHALVKLFQTYSDEESLFTIGIKRNGSNFTAHGKMFISKNDYAIKKLEYAVYDRRKENLDSSIPDERFKGQLVFEVTTEYKRGLDDKMYLNYISFHNVFSLAEPPKFAVKHLTVLPEKGAFAIRFNNALAHVETRFGDDIVRLGEAKADSRYWYRFKYRDKKIKFDNIRIINDSTVYLYPKMDSIALNTMVQDLIALKNNDIDIGTALKFTVSGLVDKDGNSINTQSYEDYDQFREFFVQEVRPYSLIPNDSLFMDKKKPIFKDQPVYKPDNFDDYWMNTPLKEKIN